VPHGAIWTWSTGASSMSLFEQLVNEALRNQNGLAPLQAQSREEILSDKLIAFALRPNRLKNPDLWDIAWLHQQGVVLPLALLPLKLRDRHCDSRRFLRLLAERRQALLSEPQLYDEFRQEMRRFLPAGLVAETVEQPAFWSYLTSLIAEECQRASDSLSTGSPAPRFRM